MRLSSKDLYNRANAAMRAEDYPTAVALYGQSLAIDSSFDLAYYNRGLCLLRLEDEAGLVDLVTAARMDCRFEPLYDAIARHGCSLLGFVKTFGFLSDEEISEGGRELIRAALIGLIPQAHYLFAGDTVQSGALDLDSLRGYCLLVDGASSGLGAKLPRLAACRA